MTNSEILRRDLLRAIKGVLERRISVEEADAICGLAQNVNNSLLMEYKMTRLLTGDGAQNSDGHMSALAAE